MAPGPAQPPAPEQPQDDRSGERAATPPPGAAAAEEASPERYGPLSLTRVGKDDGRALILYGHDEPSAERGDAGAREPARGEGPA